MARFSLIQEKHASGEVKRIFREILEVKHLRKVPNFFKTLATNLTVLEGTWSVYRHVSTQGLIPESVKEMMFVAISVAKQCKYCEVAHVAFCRTLKVDPENCENLVRNLDAIKPERTREIIRFAVKTAVDSKSLANQDYKSLAKHKISADEIVEIVAMSAFATNVALPTPSLTDF
jgi:uncharacterized peroxidase-related enzyme